MVIIDCHLDLKSTRLNSSHLVISYAVFCLKKKIHLGRPLRLQGAGRDPAVAGGHGHSATVTRRRVDGYHAVSAGELLTIRLTGRVRNRYARWVMPVNALRAEMVAMTAKSRSIG